jgi:hypothetical protein
MKASITDIHAYFKAFSESQNIAFVYGPAKKLIAKSQSSDEFSYPILHLNRPIIKPVSNRMANYTTSFELEISVLDYYSLASDMADNDASELEAESVTLGTILTLLKQMHHDNVSGAFMFEFSGSIIEPVANTFIDYHTGWRTTINMEVFANDKLC